MRNHPGRRSTVRGPSAAVAALAVGAALLFGATATSQPALARAVDPGSPGSPGAAARPALTSAGERPGWGCGDANHVHTGPPGRPGAASPCDAVESTATATPTGTATATPTGTATATPTGTATATPTGTATATPTGTATATPTGTATATPTGTATATPTGTATATPTGTATATPTGTATATPTGTATLACPCTLFAPDATPATASFPDFAAVELGVKFHADVAGVVTAVRFYKGPANPGPHPVRLWRADGQLLASATAAGETADGWQEVLLPAPVPVAAGVTYVAAYHAPAGGYAVTRPYFLVPTDRPPLHAPASAAAGGNGVFAYGPPGAFPTGTFEATNYWVDVVFVPDPALAPAGAGALAAPEPAALPGEARPERDAARRPV